MTARNHHYLSQCYLRGFTKGGSKNSKLTVFDLYRRKLFKANPRNVGGIRDFNRVDIEGIDPNAIESAYSNFEAAVAASLKKIEESEIFEGENKINILNLIALYSARSPKQREHWRKFHERTAEVIMGITLTSEMNWRTQMKQLKANGYSVPENITYEEMKNFYEGKKYAIELTSSHRLWIEMAMIEKILPWLFRRDWLMVHATKESGNFISSDKPVILTWIDPEMIQDGTWYGSGFGLDETAVIFPLSSKFAIIGRFNGSTGTFNADKFLMASLNRIIISNAREQLFCSNEDFYFMGEDNTIRNGAQVLDYFVSKNTLY